MATTDVKTRTRPLEPERRVAFYGSWDLYEALSEAIGDRQPVRLAFDGARIELMSPSRDHDELKIQAGFVVRGLAAGLGLACRGSGSTTRKQPPERGVEPDESFDLTREKIEAAVARRRGRKPDPTAPPGPVPDLAVEIDLSPSELDRPSIYAALGAPEVWRYDGARVVIERRTPEGTLVEAGESGWFGVRPDEVERFLAEEVFDDRDFMEHVAAWARQVLLPRVRNQGA
jgi:Uma2 family endonuclease